MNAHQRRVKRRRLERSYEAYLDACAARCRCCAECRSGTCDGVLQGASCDGLCFCGDEDSRDPYEDDGDEDDGDEEPVCLCACSCGCSRRVGFEGVTCGMCGECCFQRPLGMEDP